MSDVSETCDFRENLIDVTIGNDRYRFWISDYKDCCEIFGVRVYINGTVVNHMTISGAMEIVNFLKKKKTIEPLKINKIIPFLERGRDDYSVTSTLTFGSETFEVILYNEHNGYYSHAYSISRNGKILDEGDI